MNYNETIFKSFEFIVTWYELILNDDKKSMQITSSIITLLTF